MFKNNEPIKNMQVPKKRNKMLMAYHDFIDIGRRYHYDELTYRQVQKRVKKGKGWEKFKKEMEREHGKHWLTEFEWEEEAAFGFQAGDKYFP